MEEIGRHRIHLGDVTNGGVAELMGDERADVVYVDPPWGQALLTNFATQAGASPRLPWRGFLDVLAMNIAAVVKPEAPIFVEMGCRWTKDLDEAMALWRMPLIKRWDTTYGSAKKPAPCTLALFGTRDVDVVMPSPPHGEAITRAALAAVVRPGMIVLDPCTGLGMTARVTHALGGCFRGLELVPKRLDRTAQWLRKHVDNAAFWEREEARKAEQRAAGALS